MFEFLLRLVIHYSLDITYRQKFLIAAIPDLSRFGHSSIVSGNNLVLYGGLSDVVMNELGFLQLPDFVISNGYHCVKDYTDRVNCEADLSCVWCSKSSELKDQGVCVGHYGAQVICGSVSNPACPGLCPILSSCTNCLAFKDERQCSWCSKVMCGSCSEKSCVLPVESVNRLAMFFRKSIYLCYWRRQEMCRITLCLSARVKRGRTTRLLYL